MKRQHNTRAKKARDRILDEACIDYVTDVYEAPSFVEVHGMSGGNDVCYRVYDNGRIYER